MTPTQKMVRFIQDHGHQVHIDATHQDLRCLDVWTWRDDHGKQHVGEEWTTVPAAWGAVREWLGY